MRKGCQKSLERIYKLEPKEVFPNEIDGRRQLESLLDPCSKSGSFCLCGVGVMELHMGYGLCNIIAKSMVLAYLPLSLSNEDTVPTSHLRQYILRLEHQG